MPDITLRTVTGRVTYANNAVGDILRVRFRLSGYDVETSTDNVLVPEVVEVVPATDGSISADLFPNTLGLRSSFYQVSVLLLSGGREQWVTLADISVPDTGNSDLSDLLPADVILSPASASEIAQAKERANHTGTQSVATLTETATLKVLTADERTRIATAPTAGDLAAATADIAAKADATEVQALSTTVAGKADTTALEATNTALTATNATVTALSSDVDDKADETALQATNDDLDRRVVSPDVQASGTYANQVIAEDDNGIVLIDAAPDATVAVSGTRFRPSLETELWEFGAYDAVKVDTQGLLSGTYGPQSLDVGYQRATPPGTAPSGLMTRVRRRGAMWQYELWGVTYNVFDTGDQWAPHLPATQAVTVVQGAGQSWNTRLNDPSLIDVEDPTGVLRARVESLRGEIAILRTNTAWTGAFPWTFTDHPFRIGYSTTDLPGGGVVDNFRSWTAANQFTIAEVAAVEMRRQLRDWHLDDHATLVMASGRAGTAKRFFVPTTTTYSWTGGSETGEVLTNESRTLFDADVARRSEIVTIAENNFGVDPQQVYFDMQVWMQGGADSTPEVDDIGEYRAFLDAYRAAINALNLQTSDGENQHIFVNQQSTTTREDFMGYVPMDQLRFCQDNVDGRNWMTGPKYHLPYLDHIHQSALSGARQGAMVGLAMAHVRAFGFWQPWWITAASVSGSNLIITTNQPAAADTIEIDTTTVEAAPSSGFTLRAVSGTTVGADIALGAVQITNDTTLTIPITGSLAGVTQVEVGYAARGTTRPDGTEQNPTLGSAFGNMKRRGKYHSKTIGERLDLWLCNYVLQQDI